MYDGIMTGFDSIASVFTMEVLTIIAVSLLGAILLAHIIYAICFKLLICKRKGECIADNCARRFRYGMLALGWSYFALAFICVAFLFAGQPAGTVAMHMTVPVVTLALIYLFNFIFFFFHNCRCKPACTNCKVEQPPVKVIPIEIEQEPEHVFLTSRPKKEKKPKQVKQKSEPKQRKEAASLNTNITPAKPKRNPAKPHKPRLSPQPKETTTKPLFKNAKHTPATHINAETPYSTTTVTQVSPEHKIETTTTQTVEKTQNLTSSISATAREVNLYSDGTVTGKEVSSNAKSTTQLRAERENLRAEYDKLEQQLKQMRDDNLKKLSDTPAQTIHVTGARTLPTTNFGTLSTPSYTKTGYYSDANSFQQTGAVHTSSKSSSQQKFNEEEVKAALSGLKNAMGELQEQIDRRGE